jgi:hypothetical protein
MIGMIKPLVKGSSRKTLTALALFWFGALVSSTMVGAALSAVGLFIRPALSERKWWLAIAGLAIVLALTDIGIRGLHTPGLRRQTCSRWWHTIGPTRAWLAWGADLGLGVATIRATSVYWIVVATVVLVAPMASGPLILCAYSVGLATGLGAAAVLNRFVNLKDGGAMALIRLGPAIGVASGALLTVFAAITIASTL